MVTGALEAYKKILMKQKPALCAVASTGKIKQKSSATWLPRKHRVEGRLGTYKISKDFQETWLKAIYILICHTQKWDRVEESISQNLVKFKKIIKPRIANKILKKKKLEDWHYLTPRPTMELQ